MTKLINMKKYSPSEYFPELLTPIMITFGLITFLAFVVFPAAIDYIIPNFIKIYVENHPLRFSTILIVFFLLMITWLTYFIKDKYN